MRFGTWNVRCTYRSDSLKAVAEEISNYKLDLVGIQEVRWGRGGIEPVGEKRVKFVSDRMSYIERFSLRKLYEVEGKEQYCVEISNRFVALEKLDTEVDVNKAWETIRENIKISAKESLGYYELKKHKP
ncbi:hypothetical protein B7P43_G00700 [Cryptotermes secundus]|uniref:Endonuclease/exonuclease/phosphatase domain-containing protein n=1 Tax=Cryptotermes secundus TaxID=105785 RepID=A0A2J7QU94_9NEOP|nr:hypothetical protein B7P43_G00700 [Cryptotermes secundus]